MSGDSNKSQAARIPVQTQISPELEEKLEQEGLAEEQFYRNLYFYRNIGIVLLVMGLPLVIVYYFTTVDRNLNQLPDSTEIAEPLDDLEFLLARGSVFKLEDYSRQLDRELASRVVPRQLAALKNRLRIADELIRRREDDDSFRNGVITKINTLSALATFDRETNQPANPFGSDLLIFCEQFAYDKDPKIRDAARLGEINAHINSYLLEPTDQEFAKLESKLGEFISGLTSDVDIASEIPMLVRFMSNSKIDEHVHQFKLQLANSLQSSDEVVLKEIGDKIRDQLVVGSVNFDDLRRLIQFRDPQAIAKLEDLVNAVVDDPNISSSAYVYILTLVESLQQIDQNELEVRLREQLTTAVGKIANPDKRRKVGKWFDDYRIRNELIGKTFELGDAVIANPKLKMAAPTVILFLSPATQLASEWIELLQGIEDHKPHANRYVIVCVDPELTEEFRQQFKKQFPAGILIGPEKSVRYLEQCPISQVPYVVILDDKQRVIAVNVDVYQIRSRLSELNRSMKK